MTPFARLTLPPKSPWPERLPRYRSAKCRHRVLPVARGAAAWQWAGVFLGAAMKSSMIVCAAVVVCAALGCGAETSATTGIDPTGGTVTTSAGGAGGEDAGGAGGATSAGGGGSTSSAGGSGGAGGSTTSLSGSGGTGGTCEGYVCQPKDCGVVDNGCDPVADCGGCGDNPMTCGGANTCECAPEGNSVAAMAFCEGAKAEPAVNDWCVQHGGCSTALCGSTASTKTPDTCIFSGQALKPVPQDPNTWVNVWCCEVAN